MKRAMLFLFVLITFLTANATDLKLKGDWGYSLDYASKTVRLTGAKLINNETGGKSGTIRLRLYLTDTKYSAGSISGYNLCEYTFDQLEGGYYYENINKTLNFSSQPPTGSYYVTLSLAEYSDDGYVMMDYLNFDAKIASENTTKTDNTKKINDLLAEQRTIQLNIDKNLRDLANQYGNLNSVADIYNKNLLLFTRKYEIDSELAELRHPNSNDSEPNNIFNAAPNMFNSTKNYGRMKLVREVCSSCKGTGLNRGKEYGAKYGLENTYTRTACSVCGDFDSHYHKTCYMCRGLKYTESYK